MHFPCSQKLNTSQSGGKGKCFFWFAPLEDLSVELEKRLPSTPKTQFLLFLSNGKCPRTDHNHLHQYNINDLKILYSNFGISDNIITFVFTSVRDGIFHVAREEVIGKSSSNSDGKG